MKLDQSTVDRYLEPKLLQALSRLPLFSRRVVEGASVGTHRSPFKGFSTEFADHRQYVQGDDLRHLDWKVYSRTERYYIKRYEENTNLRGYVILDCSGSMNFPRPRSARAGQLSKYQYACHLAAGLAYVLISQQDPVGLVLFNDDVVASIPPMRSLAHLRRLLTAMDETQPADKTDAGKALQAVVGMIGRRGLVLIISDLMDDPDKVVQALAHLRQRGHDAIVLQVMDEAELNFPYQKTMTLRDLETMQTITVQGKEIAGEYTKALNALLERYKKACFEHGFDYVLASTSTPYELLLTALLTRRQR